MEKEEFRICPFCKSKVPASLDECPVCHRVIVERPIFIYVDGKPYNNQSVEPPETNASVKPPRPKRRRIWTKGRIIWSIFAIVLISWMAFATYYSHKTSITNNQNEVIYQTNNQNGINVVPPQSGVTPTYSESKYATITYRIGTIDPRFNISKDTFSKIVNDAANRWNKVSGKNLLAYDINGDVPINLVYDYRQEYSDGMKKIEEEFKDLPSMENEISKLETYINSEQQKLDADTDDYNSRVDYWNAKGGAPPEEYDQLKAEEKDINNREKKLDNDTDRYNNLVSQYNKRVAEENQKINALELQYDLSSNNEEKDYETSGVYKEGFEIAKEIVIYTFDDTNELRLIIMHEFGHALGAGHANSINSIMYPIINDITLNMSNPIPSTEDLSLISGHP